MLELARVISFTHFDAARATGRGEISDRPEAVPNLLVFSLMPPKATSRAKIVL